MVTYPPTFSRPLPPTTKKTPSSAAPAANGASTAVMARLSAREAIIPASVTAARTKNQ